MTRIGRIIIDDTNCRRKRRLPVRIKFVEFVKLVFIREIREIRFNISFNYLSQVLLITTDFTD